MLLDLVEVTEKTKLTPFEKRSQYCKFIKLMFYLKKISFPLAVFNDLKMERGLFSICGICF